MSKEKKSLGRGLDSLLGERSVKPTQGVLEVPLEDLVPGQYQPRNKMRKDTLEELSKSIKTQGVLQPILARKKAEIGYYIMTGFITQIFQRSPITVRSSLRFMTHSHH